MCFFVAAVSNAGVIVIEGNYQNKNIFIQNAFANSGVGFCTYEVSINGQVSTDEINSSAFEVDLSQYELEYGESVTVVIKHKNDDCFPKVINPEVLKPVPTFETTTIDISNTGMLQWTAVNEVSKLPYEIEQFKWNKWIKVGEVEGRGVPSTNEYYFQTTPVSGLNKFRVKQKGYIDKTRYTSSVSYTSLQPDITYVYVKKNQRIDFSEKTAYEIFDRYGNLLKTGFGKQIPLKNLSKDTYYMNYGNSTTSFKRR